MPIPARSREALVYVALVALIVLAGWAIGTSAAQGLNVRFWRTADWSGPPSAEAAGSLPTAGHFLRDGPPAGLPATSAEWTGYFFADRAGSYEFEVASDDGAWLYLDDALVVDNGGEHGRQVTTARVELATGAHPLRVRYFQAAGDLALEVYWSGPETPRRFLRTGDVTSTDAGARRASSRSLVRALALGVVVVGSCLLLYVPARLAAWWLSREVCRVAPVAADRRALQLVLLLGFGLLVWGLDWGLDALWAPDELPPSQVREVVGRRFADGWYDKYPLMHYVVLGVPVSAFRLADRVGLLAADSLGSHMAQLAMMRVVSVLMGLATLVTAFLAAAELYGARRAVLGVLPLLLTALFVYYGKVANLDVPFMAWFGLAMLGFIRIWKTDRFADYLLLGVGAAAAVATKDQAYASVALLPIGVVAAGASHRSGGSWARRLAAAAVDRRMIVAGLVSAATFALCHNALFNWRGVIDHFRLLSTLGDLAIVPRTLGGYLEMTAMTATLYRFALGWPLLVLALLGVITAARRPERRWWLWMLLVPVSFHLTFTFVTLYVNDRYLFGGLFVLSLFAGSAMADLFEAKRWPLAVRFAIAGALTYSLLMAASVNVMMNLDSRRQVRAWLDVNAPEGAGVGLVGMYGPSLEQSVRGLPLRATVAEIQQWQPDYIAINARFAGRYAYERRPEGRDLVRALADGSLGYVEVLRSRASVPWWAVLQYDPEYRSPSESVLTNLDKINPEMVVYERRAR